MKGINMITLDKVKYYLGDDYNKWLPEVLTGILNNMDDLVKVRKEIKEAWEQHLEASILPSKCGDCEGKGYYTDVISSGLSDPKDPYHKPHIERCDTCKVFNDDVEAKEYHEKVK